MANKINEPLDMNINNNDYSEKLLANINSELKNFQINVENSAKELDEQAKLLISSTKAQGSKTTPLPIIHFFPLIIPEGSKFNLYVLFSITIVWPALFPP